MDLALLAAASALGAERLAVVLGNARLPHADLLALRDGTWQTGVVSQTAFRLHTAHGDLEFPTTSLAAFDLADDRAGLCSVVTEAGDRLTGFLSEPGFALESLPGARPATVPREQVVKLLFRLRAPLSSPPPRSCLARLRNGDFLVANLVEGRFRSSSESPELQWDRDAVVSADFVDPRVSAVRLLLPDGTVHSAQPDASHLEFQLASGLRLRVFVGWLERLERVGSTGRPPELMARIGAPPRLEPNRSTNQVGPEAGVVPVPGLVWLPPGEFTMGSPPEESDRDLDEGPTTRVVFTHGFWIGRCEVTQTEYQRVQGQNPSQYQYEGETLHPVEKVTWLDAMDYCRRLTLREHADGNLPETHAYRLPTEAEWEYACRAGTTTRFSFGDDSDYALARNYVWFSRNSESTTHPVGAKQPNPWGLHDMHGNVLEWCLDAWHGSLPGGSVTNIAVSPEGTLRAVRGGSWLYDARYARSANRDSYGSLIRCSDLGFRIVLARVP